MTKISKEWWLSKGKILTFNVCKQDKQDQKASVDTFFFKKCFETDTIKFRNITYNITGH